MMTNTAIRQTKRRLFQALAALEDARCYVFDAAMLTQLRGEDTDVYQSAIGEIMAAHDKLADLLENLGRDDD